MSSGLSKIKKVLSIAVGAVIAIIGGYFVLNNFIIAPQEVEAKEYMWQAQQAFAKDSFELAIYGDESTVGLDYIIDEYGMTKAANLAHYYVGVSHLHLGNFEEASEYLSSYSCDDVLVCAVAYGANGDAHLELGEYSDALSLYKRAVDHSDNELTTPIYLKKQVMRVSYSETMLVRSHSMSALKKNFQDHKKRAIFKSISRE